jgi:hypothetical protein
MFTEAQRNPDLNLLLTHEDGVPADAMLLKMYKKQMEHDPADIHQARELAHRTDVFPLGLLYRDPQAPVYEDYTTLNMDMSVEDKLAAVNEQLDRFAV